MSNKEDANLAKIRRGLRGFLARGPAERIELRHVQSTGGEAVTLTLSGPSLKEQISSSGGLENAATQLAEELLEAAEEDAKSMRGVNRYGVCMYHEGDREYRNRVLITIRGTLIEDSDVIEETEPANATGIVSQVMRHNEVLAKSSAMHHERILERYESMHKEDRDLIRHLVEQHTRVLELHETLMDRKVERDISVRKEIRNEQMVTKGIEQLMMLAGPLMKKILPSNNPIAQEVAEDNILITLMASFKEEQLMQIFPVLTPEQRASFMELYQSLKQRYEKVKVSAETSTGTTPSQQEPKT